MNVWSLFVIVLLEIIGIRIVVLLDKEIEVLEMMIEHGILEKLCEIFSTCQDEDTLVWRLW